MKTSVPVVVLLAVDISVPGETCEFGVEGQFAFATFQTGRVPLSVDGQEVVSVVNPSAASRAARHLDPVAAPEQSRARARTGARNPARLSLLQHPQRPGSVNVTHMGVIPKAQHQFYSDRRTILFLRKYNLLKKNYVHAVNVVNFPRVPIEYPASNELAFNKLPIIESIM